MKKPSWKIAKILIAIFCLSALLLTSCENPETPPDDEGGEKEDPTVVTDYGIDNVFFMEEGGKEYLFTISGNTFLISGLNGDQKGTFTYADGALALTFKQGDATKASATLEGDVLKLVYEGNTYRMVKRTYFAVKYADGDATLATANVRNGMYAAKPADPKKDGCAFIGWYADAAFENAFAFDTTAITQNTTVYARFETLTAGKTEYNVSLFCEGIAYDSVKTVNGIVYNLPTPEKAGATFVGWWISDFQNVEKLTCRYNGQELTQDTTLFAVFQEAGVPNISVNATGATWDAQGAGVNYRVTVKKDDKVVAENNVGTNSYTFDFAGQPAGEYSVTVTVNGKSATAYYKNKALDRASNFRVISSNVLVFDPVKNAEKYLITAVCGNGSHSHVAVDNGNSTNFNFANCDMPADGIKFVVTAIADGYLESVSELYVVSRSLDAVEGITVTDRMITWYPVENATAYYVEVSADGTNYKKSYVASGTSFGITDLDAGQLYVKVTPVSNGYYSAPAEAVSYTKKALAVPTNISVSGKDLTWNAVAGATGYNVTVDGTVYTATTNSLALADILKDGKIVYTVSVQALADKQDAASPYSAQAQVNYATMGNVTYKNGVVSWTPVYGATGYKVKVGTREYTVDASKSSCNVTFTESGVNKVSVCFLDDDGDASNWASVNVTTYKTELDTRGGVAVPDLYLAIGDDIVLPATSRDGYDFAGWFTAPNALTNNGKAFDKVRLEENNDTILFAAWSAQKYTITLNAGSGSVSVPSYSATYGKVNVLPVGTIADGTKMFCGWFTEPNGAGIRYFDENGVGLSAWNNTSDLTLYAYFAETLTFNLINNGTAYSVEKGPYGIGTLTSITIPATYNDLPVTTVEAAAFQSCSTLLEINIPNTIVNIELGTQGINGTGSAFQSCSNLAAINIYEVEGAKEARYHSVDGILYYDNEFNGMEIKAVPYAKTGIIQIEEGTTTIPAGALRSNYKITEIFIPYTVTNINAEAIYSYSKLTKIVFLAAPEGVEELPLVMAEKAIYSCSALTEITLPARIAEFKPTTIGLCSALDSIDVVGVGGNYSSKGEAGRKVLCNAAGDTLVFCPKGMDGAFTIPSGVTTIGEEAFASCSKLTELTIPGFVTEIGKNAFKSCSGLTKLTFEEGGSPLTIRESAFYSCSKLTELTLPSGLVKLEINAFGATSNLTKVTVNSTGVAASEGADRVVDFATNAFASTAASPAFYVTDVIISKQVPTFDLTGVFGQKIENVTVDPGNEFYASIDGVLFDKNVSRLLYYPMNREGAYTLPESVVELGDRVFQARTGLNKITIGKNVTSIGIGTFQSCSKLETVIFEDGGTEELVINDNAFSSCSALLELKLPTRLTTIGKSAFSGCSKITSLVIPEGVTTIGTGAFASCNKLVTLTLPSTLTNLEVSMVKPLLDSTVASETLFPTFTGCAALETIIIPESNPYYAVIDNILYSKSVVKEGENPVVTDLWFCPLKKAGSTKVTIPGTVTYIHTQAFYVNKVLTEVDFEPLQGGSLTFGEAAFSDCEKLTRIALPDGLKTIATNMFYMCYSLEEIVIPKSVTSIENKAFKSCKALTSLVFEEGGTEPLVIEDVTTTSSPHTWSPFHGCANLKNVVFPERMTYLGAYAFGGFAGDESTYGASYEFPIESVTFPSTLERIGHHAFYYAKSLKSVTFAPGTVLKDEGTNSAIGENAFYHADALYKVVLPDSPNPEDKYTIGKYAFSYTSVISVVLPDDVTKLGDYAFNYCKKLMAFTFADGVAPELGADMFQYSSIEYIMLPEGITSIPEYCFRYSALRSVVIPSTVEEIGVYAFADCTNLENVTFATYLGADGKPYSRCATIRYEAFEKTKITSFTFPTLEGDGTLVLHGSKAVPTSTTSKLFNNCKLLETVTLSKSVGDITDVFNGCFSIKNFIIDDRNENFSSRPGSQILFNKEGTSYKYVCGQLVGELIIPDDVLSIDSNTFKGQTMLTRVVIPNTMQKIGDYAFAGCTCLTEVIFQHSEASPSQMTADDAYGTYMFQNCTSLETLVLPGNMPLIPKRFADNCPKIESLTLPEGITSIGEYAFTNCHIKNLVIPSTVKSIGNYAFQGKNLGTSTDWRPGGGIESLTFAKDIHGNCALTSLGTYVFQYQNFPSVVIPKSLTSMLGNIFSFNTNLTSFTFEEGTTIDALGASMIQGCTKIKSITIPASVERFSSNMFKDCWSLEEVIFEEGSKLRSMSTSTFENCTSLKSITLPDSLTAFNSSYSTSTKKYTDPSVTSTSKTNTFANCTALEHVELGSGLLMIDPYAFTGCTALKSITIPDTVKTIGAYSFNLSGIETVNFTDNSALNLIAPYAFQNCTELESIVIPKGVTVLGTTATAGTASSAAHQFEGCTSLETVTFKGSIKLLGGYVFQNCSSLQKFTVPSSLTQIGNYCFDGCSSLSEVDFGASSGVTTLGTYAFRNCTALENITIPKITKIDTYTFDGCANLKTVNAPKVTSLGNYCFRNCAVLDTITVGNYTTIGTSTFEGCKALTSITLPATLTSIGDKAFMGTSITSITIPKAVKTITNNPFNGCDTLTEFKVDAANATFTATDGALVKKADGTIVAIPASMTGTLTLPKGAKIGPYFLAGCPGVTEVILPEDMTEIPAYAFNGSGITTFTLPATITKIGNYAFANTPNLKEFKFAEGFTNDGSMFGSYMFQNSGIESITYPASVVRFGSTNFISSYTFDGCANLKEVVFEGPIESIGGYMFRNCTSLKNITLPDSLTIMGTYAFQGCGLESIVIPKGITSLYSTSSGPSTSVSTTFKDCTSLKSVVFEGPLTIINGSAFSGCTALESIVIPATVKELGASAFLNCTSLKQVIFEAGSQLTTINASVFSGSGIESITLPENVTAISAGSVFKDCASLKSVTFAGPITQIGANFFENCTALESFEIPRTLEKIGGYVFQGSGLKSIFIPSTFCPSSMNTSMFKGCVNLETVVFEEGCGYIGGSCFSGCTALKSVTMPDTVTYIGNFAFEDCTNIKDMYVSMFASSVFGSTFKGWTSAQTLHFRGSKSSSSTWSAGWDDHDAVMIWDCADED